MKRLIFSFAFLFALTFCSSVFAGVDIHYAEWGKIVGLKRIAVEFSTDSLKYKHKRPFAEFLYKAKRVKDWKAQSLGYFIGNFNERLAVFGIEAYDADGDEKSSYVLRLVPQNVTSGGKLEGYATVVESLTGNMVVGLYFSTSDGDDDDEITFRDPLKELGDCVGKAFVNGLKKL